MPVDEETNVLPAPPRAVCSCVVFPSCTSGIEGSGREGAGIGGFERESLSSCACRASNGRFVRTVADGIMDGDWCPVIGTAALSPEWRSAF